MTYRDWTEPLAPDVELWTVTLPGRGPRRNESFANEWAPLVEELTEAILEEVTPPLAIFGHSLGALLGFEVTHALARRDATPRELIASGRAAPDVPARQEVPHTDEELLREIEHFYGGLPALVRDTPEVLDQSLPILRADLELAVAYTHHPRPPLPCPLTVLGGYSDPLLPPGALEAWERQAGAGFELHRFPAGHFYEDEVETAVLQTIERRLVGQPDERTPSAEGRR